MKVISFLVIFSSLVILSQFVVIPKAEALAIDDIQPRSIVPLSDIHARHIYIVYETGIVQRLVDTGIESQSWVKSQLIPNGYSLHYEVGKYYLIPTSLYFHYPTQGITVR